jgi:hypothetical protein
MEKYTAQRDYLKEKTIKAHISKYNKILKYLQKYLPYLDCIEDYMFLKDSFNNLVKKFIDEEINIGSATTYISTIRLIISPNKDNPQDKYKIVYNKWNDYYNLKNEKYRKYKIDQTKTKKQGENWMSWEKVIDFRNSLTYYFHRKIKLNSSILTRWKKANKMIGFKGKVEKKKIIKFIKSNFNKYKYYLMLCLHTMMEAPVRLEYAEMINVTNKTTKINQEKVYLNNEKRLTKQIIFGKLSRKNPMKEVLILDVPSELCKIINTYDDMKTILELNKDTLFNTNKNKYSKNFIAFMERETGNKIGVAMLRSIYVTHIRGGEMKRKLKKRVCLVMNHSIFVQEDYYLKHD